MNLHQFAGNHEMSLRSALNQNIRPVQEVGEIKQEFGKVKAASKRFIRAYEPIYGPVFRGIGRIPCHLAHLVSGTICLPNHLLGKIFHPGGHFSTIKHIFSKVAGFPCHLTQHSAKAVCHPKKTFSRVMEKVQRGGRERFEAGGEFDTIYHTVDKTWYPIESTEGRKVLADYLAYIIEAETVI